MFRAGIRELATGALLVAASSCAPGRVPNRPGVNDPELRQIVASLGLTGDAAEGRSLPSIDDPLAQLGRQLFFSKTLSGDFDVACASCHHPALGGGDGLSLPVGVASGTPDFVGPGRSVVPAYDFDRRHDGGPNVARNAPSIFGVGLRDRALFFDGSVASLSVETAHGAAGQPITTPDRPRGDVDPDAGSNLLEAQAASMVVDLVAMRGFGPLALEDRDGVRDVLVGRLRGSVEDANLARNEWLAAFRRGYADETGAAEALISKSNVWRAIAAYEASMAFTQNRFREYVRGNYDALTEQQKRGALDFFRARDAGGAGCA